MPETSDSFSSRREFFVQAAGALTTVAILPELARGVIRPAEPVTLGLVGAGKQGRAIIAEVAKFENVKLTGVCDTDETRRNAGARRVPDCAAFASLADMLAAQPALTGIIIATPTHQHKEPALGAIAAGKHVYCEAPLAHTVEDCRAIAQAAGKSGRVFAVGFEGRSNPVYKLARTFFRSDSTRDLVAIDAANYKKDSWRVPSSSGGAEREKELNWRLDPAVSLGLAGEWLSHQFDVAHWYTDKLPVSVIGSGGVHFHKDGRTIADTVACSLRFENNVLLNAQASLANSYLGKHEIFRGSNAAIKLAWTHGWMFKEADAPTQGWEVYANRQQFHNDEGITLIADATKLASQGKLKEGVGLPNPSLYYALVDFIDSMAGGKPAGCDANAGAKSSIVAIMAARAIATGEPVTLDPALMQF